VGLVNQGVIAALRATDIAERATFPAPTGVVKGLVAGTDDTHTIAHETLAYVSCGWIKPASWPVGVAVLTLTTDHDRLALVLGDLRDITRRFRRGQHGVEADDDFAVAHPKPRLGCGYFLSGPFCPQSISE
jgi:hypothetical protein